MRRVSFVSAMLIFCLGAQTPDTASIRGQILDQTGGAIKGASISLLNRDTGAKRAMLADDAGMYQFSGLPLTGSYQLTIAKEGFASEQPAGLTLRGNEIA